MEFHILNTLSFNFTFPTPLRFLERYMKLLDNDQTVMFYATFLIELALIEVRMLQYPPSILAASAIYLACKNMFKQS